MRVLVTGSRGWTNVMTIWEALEGMWAATRNHPDGPDPNPFVVVHGDCPSGADKLASEWCRWSIGEGRRVAEEPHPADWSRYGKSAGFRRNAEMVETGVDVCLSFNRGGSRGTRHCTNTAKRAGVPTIEYREGGDPPGADRVRLVGPGSRRGKSHHMALRRLRKHEADGGGGDHGDPGERSDGEGGTPVADWGAETGV